MPPTSPPPSVTSSEDSAPPAPPAAEEGGRARRRAGAAIVAGWGAYSVAMVLLWEAARPSPGTSLCWSVPVTLASGGYWAAATPLVRGLARRFTPARVGRARSVLLHGLAGLALALAGVAARWAVFRAMYGPPGPSFLGMVGRLLDVHLCLYALIVALTAAADANRAYAARTRRALTLEAQLARARVEFLQRQLQPHFLFNALNAVAELTREAPAQAARMLRQLARLLRAATAHLAGAEVPLLDELTVLDAYADVQRTRFGDGLVVAYDVAPGARGALVPPFVLQPLVENAIRHGLAARAGCGRVTVSAAAAGGRLRLVVANDGATNDGATNGGAANGGADRGAADDGPAAPPARGREAPPRRGIGLVNTAARLEHLYGPAHRLEVRVDPAGGSAVALEVPLRRAPAGEALGRALGTPSDAPLGTPPMPSAGPNGWGAPAAGAAAVVAELFAPVRRPRPPRGLVAWARRHARRGGGEPARGAGPAPAPGGEVPLRGARRVAALWAAVALCWTVQLVLIRWAQGGAAAVAMWWRWDTALQWVGAVLWALLTPAVLRLARAVPITRERWAAPLAMHLALAAGVAVAQLALQFRLMGKAPPLLSPDMVNPLSLNACIYVALVAWTHARVFAAWYQERETAAERLAADLERTRLQSLAVEVNPDYVTALLEACAELAPGRPAAAEALVERTADLLRTMLDAAGARVPTLRAELRLLRESLALLEAGTGRPARLRVDVPARWEGAAVARGGLRAVLGPAAARVAAPGGGGVDVVVAPADPQPAGGGPSPLGAPVGWLAARVAAVEAPSTVPNTAPDETADPGARHAA